MLRAVLSFALLVCYASPGWAARSFSSPGDLPELPQITPASFPLPVREKVREALAAALAHPEDAAANGRLGMILQANDPADQRAKICYERARRLDPKSFRWAYFLGSVQAARGEHPEAIQAFHAALALDPEYLPAQLKLGESYLASGDAAKARQWFEKALVRHPDSAQALYGLGRAQTSANDLQGTIASLRKAVELFPYFGAAHYALGLAYQRSGKMAEAREEFALYERYKYDIPGAGDRFQAELNELYTSPASLLELGVYLERQGKLLAAAEKHEAALAIDPQLVRAHINLIPLYGRLQQYTKAEAHFQAAVRLDPNSAESFYNYGTMLLHQARYAEAEEALRTALRLDPRHAEAHNNLGDILQRRGKIAEAMAEFRQAIELRPDFSPAHFNLGRILVNQAKYDEGIQEFLQALNSSGKEDRPVYLYALGAACARAGQREQALRYLESARQEVLGNDQAKLRESIERDLQQMRKSGTN